MSRDQVMMSMDAMVVKVTSIGPNPYQPRRHFRPGELAELQASIDKNGLLQRLVVRPAGPAAAKGVEFELIAGERRWRSVTALGWVDVPVDVRDVDDATMALLAATENIQRAALSAVEEARAYRVLIEQFGYTQAEVAGSVLGDASRQPLVSQRLGLLELPDRILELIEDGRLHWTHARDHLRSFLKRGTPIERDAFFYTVANEVRERTEDGEAIARERLVEVIQAAAWACLGDEPEEPEEEAAEASDSEEMGPAPAALQPALHAAGFSVHLDLLRDLGEAEREEAIRFAYANRGRTPQLPLIPPSLARFAWVPFSDGRADPPWDGFKAVGWRDGAAGEGPLEPVPLDSLITQRVDGSDPTTSATLTAEAAEHWRPTEAEPAVFAVIEQPHDRWAIKGPLGKTIKPPNATAVGEFIDDDVRLLNAAHYSAKRCETGPVVVLGGASAPYLANALFPRREGEDSVWTVDGAHAHAETLNRAFLAGATGQPLPAPAASGKPSAPAEDSRAPVRDGSAAPPAGSDPPSAPLGSLPLPGSARREVRAGAGLIETLVTAFDGRPGTISVTPIGPNAMVIIAPRIAKAGETPLSITRPAAEISDQELAAIIDAHFT